MRARYNIFLSLFCLLLFLAKIADAESSIGSVTGLPLPRFVSIKSNEANLRSGPAKHYPIKLSYHCRNYPMELIAEFENWRLLRDIDNTQGWVHKGLISGIRNVIVKNNHVLSRKQLPYEIPKAEMVLFRLPDEHSYPIVRVELGTVGRIKRCDLEWCKISIENYEAWIRKINLWGIYENDIIRK